MLRQAICAVLLLTIWMSPLYAQLQGQARIDSLLKELPHKGEDTNRVTMLNNLSALYTSIDPDEGLKYGEQSLALSTRLGWKKGMAWAYNHLGNSKLARSENPKALEYYLMASEVFEEVGDKKGKAAVVCNIGIANRNIGNYPKALEYLLKALKLDEEAGYKRYAGVAAANIAIVYSILEDYPKELVYRLKSLKMYEEAGDKNGIAFATGNIGIYYCDALKDYPKALEYFFKALELEKETGQRNLTSIVTSNIANVYEQQKNYSMAVVYYRKALKYGEEFGAKENIANCLRHIGGLYIAIINDTALKARSTGHLPDKFVRNSESTVGGYEPDKLIPHGKPALLAAAISHLEQSLAIYKQIVSPQEMKDCYENLIRAYQLKGDYRKALDASANYHAIKDSLFSQGNSEEILKMSMKNDYDRQRLADSLKVTEKEKITALNLQRQKGYTYMGIAGILLLAGFSFFIVKERSKSESERKKSDGLLLNILPNEVATELKATGTTTAKHYNNVTVLFTDFVNFTEAGERMSPQGLIDELHTCFKSFDEITHKYNIEKIKTIGDAYLAVCGLPTADPKHAESVVRAALEINAFMQDRLAKLGSDRTFAIRIGIHTGNVVAGIVGVKKFAYDIWGDTVNTAARMEQNSEAGKINISQTTYELVKDKFHCEYRGEVEAKGKGVMKMYFVS